MALLVDGELSTLTDLESWDSGVIEVAHGEGIDLQRKMELARKEIEIEVEALLRRADAGRMEEVVVTAAMAKWHGLLTLAMIYRDAYFSQLNDRFGGRWRAYQQEAHDAGRKVAEGGIGLVASPLRRPQGVNAALGMGTVAPRVYYVRVSWVNALGEESAPSPLEVVDARSQHSLAVSPEGASGSATGWLMYAGFSADQLKRQAGGALRLDEVWAAPDGPLDEGPGPGQGQEAQRYVAWRRLLRR